MDILNIAVSGLGSAQVAFSASAHNVANLRSEGFRPLRVFQSAAAGGGSDAVARQAAASEGVDLLDESVAQLRASHQFRASLRLFDVASELQNRLVDLFG